MAVLTQKYKSCCVKINIGQTEYKGRMSAFDKCDKDRLLFEGLICSLPDIDRSDEDEEKHRLCTVCGKRLANYDEALAHYLSRSHLKKVGIKKEILFKNCNICHVEFLSTEAFKKHIVSKEHTKQSETLGKLRQLERKVAPNKNTVEFLISVLDKRKARSKQDVSIIQATKTASLPFSVSNKASKLEIQSPSVEENEMKTTCEICNKWWKNFSTLQNDD